MTAFARHAARAQKLASQKLSHGRQRRISSAATVHSEAPGGAWHRARCAHSWLPLTTRLQRRPRTTTSSNGSKAFTSADGAAERFRRTGALRVTHEGSGQCPARLAALHAPTIATKSTARPKPSVQYPCGPYAIGFMGLRHPSNRRSHISRAPKPEAQ